MRPIQILTLAAYCCLATPAISPAQTLYSMSCGVGGGMKLILSPRGDRTFIQLRFRKASQAASVALPPPGECAWQDRPLNAEEPTLMGIEVEAELWTEFDAVGSGSASVGVVSNATNPGDQDVARDLLRAVRQGSCFTVATFNTNQGFFQIGHVQPPC